MRFQSSSISLFFLIGSGIFPALAAPSHGFSLWGAQKYDANFKHFDYANPAAPKGGALKLYAVGAFDSINPFILKGQPAAGSALPFESLMVASSDEIDSFYGLIAETVEYEPENHSISFNLRASAKWHDQKPITASDVLFSFETLLKKGTPSYRNLLKEIEKVVMVSPSRVKFTFKPSNRRDLPTIAATLPVLPKHYYDVNEFEKTTLTPPIGSGPYRISKIQAGKNIILERVKDYWGKDLPVNQGAHNFDTVQIDYYRDADVAFEAFKAGAYDARVENTTKNWMTAYNFPAVTQKKVIKEVIKNNNPADLQAIFMNQRKPMFKDLKVREALSVAFDFEWLNKNIFFNRYKRIQSIFPNTRYQALGAPSQAELTLLLPFQHKIPENVLTIPFKSPENDGSGNIRAALTRSAQLLDAAGWKIVDGKRIDKTGNSLKIELLLFNASLDRVYQPYIQNLKKLGIDAMIRMVDITQFQTRLEKFDFDMVSLRFPQPNIPSVEQFYFWSSTSAKLPGSPNTAGIENPVIDALVDGLINAKTLEQIDVYAKSLDRVILWNHYFIPAWFAIDHYFAYWDKFLRPPQLAEYASLPSQSSFDPLGFMQWWWSDPEKVGKSE